MAKPAVAPPRLAAMFVGMKLNAVLVVMLSGGCCAPLPAVPANLAGLLYAESHFVPLRTSRSRLVLFQDDQTCRTLISTDWVNASLVSINRPVAGEVAYTFEITGPNRARLSIGGDPAIDLTFSGNDAGDFTTEDRPNLFSPAGKFSLFSQRNNGPVVNQSARGYVSPEKPLHCGLVLNQSCFVLIRAVGPGLAKFGVTTAAQDPILTLSLPSTSEVSLRENDNWQETDGVSSVALLSQIVGAFPFAADSKDALLLLGLRRGAYVATAKVKPLDGGDVLLETYVIHGWN